MSNSFAVLSALIKDLNIPVSRLTIKERLEEHPDFPSLLAISDSLHSWGITHEIHRINKENYHPEQLLFPFIAHSSVNGGQFMLIRSISSGTVKFSNEKNYNAEITETDFLNHWDGILLYAEGDPESGETNYRENLIKGWFAPARIPFLLSILLAGILLILANHTPVDLPYLSLLAIKLSGIFVSILLLIYTLDTNNPFLQHLCTLGKKGNCNAILSSDAAKITNWLSWTEVGLFYFAGSFLCLLFQPQSIRLLFWLNIACLPYTFYSIGYQIRMKNWCILCCTVQALLWMEAAAGMISYAYQPDSFSYTPVALITFILFFLLPVATWLFIRPYLLKSQQVVPLMQKLNKFKYNTDLFSHFLNNQPKHTIPDDLTPFTIGNPLASTVITMVSSPFCGPCGRVHQTLDKWLKTRDDIQLKVLFATANHQNDPRTIVARHLIALSLSENSETAEKALNKWYGQSSKNYENWALEFPVQVDETLHTITEKQKEWCLQAGITHTPVIFINGRQLTEPYQPNDIEYLLS